MGLGRGLGRGMGRGMGGIFSPYHESWRKHPMLNNNLSKTLPGFGYAVAIFSTYLAFEFVYEKMFPPKHVHITEKAEFDEPLHGGAFEPKQVH